MKPVDQRLGKGDITEGLCHQCQKFVPVCNSKKKNNYMLWYRHAHKVRYEVYAPFIFKILTNL